MHGILETISCVNLKQSGVEQSVQIRYTKTIMEEYTEGYIRALGQFQGSRYDHSFIARIHYARVRKAGPDCRFRCVCLKDRKRSQLLQAEAWEGEIQVGTLQVELLFAGSKVNLTEKNRFTETGPRTSGRVRALAGLFPGRSEGVFPAHRGYQSHPSGWPAGGPGTAPVAEPVPAPGRTGNHPYVVQSPRPRGRNDLLQGGTYQ